MPQNLIGVLYTLLLIFGCFGLAFLASKRFPEFSRKIVHIGVAHWYFIYVSCFTDPLPALLGLAAFAVINGLLNVTGALSALLGQKKTERNWGLVWYPISFLTVILLCEHGIGDRTALGCAMLGLGWGDGLAALVGGKFGKRRVAGAKTWLGFFTLLIAVTVICLQFTGSLVISLAAAAAAAMLELLTPFGLDNFSVPFGIYAVITALSDHAEALNGMVFGLPWGGTAALLTVLFGALALIAFRMKLLTETGAMAAFLLGFSVTAAFRFRGLILLGVFFVSANLTGKLRSAVQHGGDAVREQKSGRRDHVQVAANGLFAAFAAILSLLFGSRAALAMFAASVAEANADTWAGELGRLSKHPPVSLRTGKAAERGLSGCVTAAGFAAGLAGAALIALFARLLFPSEISLTAAIVICACGFVGCVLDSVLGAYFQALYRDDETGSFSESPLSLRGEPLPLIRGRRWMNNDTVNLLSNAAAALAAWGIAAIL